MAPLIAGKSVKECVRKYLTEHAAELGLIMKDGRINKSAIEEIARICNWLPKGGALKTPIR